MQIKEFEAQTLKECLQLVRNAMGPDAVILETRKFRKGGVMGLGAHDAIAIVAATGITVDSDPLSATSDQPEQERKPSNLQLRSKSPAGDPETRTPEQPVPARTSAAHVAARSVYGRAITGTEKLELTGGAKCEISKHGSGEVRCS